MCHPIPYDTMNYITIKIMIHERNLLEWQPDVKSDSCSNEIEIEEQDFEKDRGELTWNRKRK